MMKKIVVGVPLLTVACLFVFIVFINSGDSEQSTVQKSKTNDVEAAHFYPSKNGFADPREDGQPIEKSLFGEPKDFALAIHGRWSEMDIEERYAVSPDSESYGLISSIVPEINFLRTNIDGALTAEFDTLQKTAYQLTNPATGLSEKERNSLIPLFENQLDKLYEIMMNR